jgi:RNA methyltransferase, TrmH family
MQAEANGYDSGRMPAAGHHNAETRGRLRRIESRHNALVKELRMAFARGELTLDSHCAVDGLRILEEAIRSGLKFRAVFFSASAEDKAERLLPQIGSHVETVSLPDQLFSSVVPSETPQGVAALVRIKSFTVEEITARAKFGPILTIAGVQDPGNLGTILRSAEAFGAGGVLLGEGTVSAYNSKTVRASAGSVFRLPVVQVKLLDVLDRLREQGVRLLATSSHKGTPLPEMQLGGPLAVLVGNEGAGLSRELTAKVDETVAIPHSSSVESLNAGVAASIVLYEAWRQRK